MSMTRRRFTRLVATSLIAPGLACTPRACTPHATAEGDRDKDKARKRSKKGRKDEPGKDDVGQRRTGAPVPRLGMNISGAADYNSELPFVDVFRMAREWISQQEGKPFGEGPKLELTEHGWVKRLAPNARAEAYLCTIPDVPAGSWNVYFDGKGEIEMWGPALLNQRKVGPRQLTFTTKSGGDGGFVLRLMKTDPQDPVRNIRVMMPGFSLSSAAVPWNPRFVERWQGMAALRFMDLMNTNGSDQRRWSDRPTMQSATFTTRGVPVELLVELANRIGAPPWFCMPHLADDDYVRRFAQVVKERLDPKLSIYVEYSNEVWNGMFQQCHYAHEQGAQLKLAKSAGIEANTRFYGRRALEIFRIWEQVFGGRERLVRVIGSQAANSHFAELILGHGECGRRVDALAIAPYISCNVYGEGNESPRANEVAGWNLDRLFKYLDETSFPECVDWMKQNKKIADKYGLQLIAYEAGQHLTGVMGGENNDAVTSLLIAAQRDPRMGAMYKRYYKEWTDAGGDLLCHFSSVGGYGKWGSWGLLESWNQDPRTAPKFMETMRWAEQRGQKVKLPPPA